MKPDGIEQEIWDAANDADRACQRDSCKDNACNGFLCANAIRSAIHEARSQTYEECAKIAYLAAMSHQDMADAENKEISDYDRQLHADIGDALDELGNMFHDAIRSKANQ